MKALVLVHEPFEPVPIVRFTQRDLEIAASDIILAMDGKIRRADALLCARAALESVGMVKSA